MSVELLLWLIWSVAVAWGWRFALRRYVFKAPGAMAWAGTYLTMIAVAVSGLLMSALSGLKLYGFDTEDPGQVLGYILLFFSPVGLPLLVGTLPMVVYDLTRALLANTKELIR